MAKSIPKTNAMRILDQAGIPYEAHTYETKDGHIDGISVAQKLNQPLEQVYKTLVTVGHSKNYYVFVIPVSAELDLKAAAKAVSEKSVEMIPVKEINKVTGYIRGGCSPIGMKKPYVTVLDESCLTVPHMIVSGGKIGFQIELEPSRLADFLQALVCPVTVQD
jgi:Cys-tRNA(Pro)/Cys-tRNA(Cys) deacylase